MKEIIKQKLKESIEQLFTHDFALIKHNVSERAICHKLAEYLQHKFPEYNVDCEYNRNATQGRFAPKVIEVLQDELNNRLVQADLEENQVLTIEVSAYPDIIVHRRLTNDQNILIVEVKKDGADIIDSEYDMNKLRAFTSPNQGYYYKLGAYVEITTGVNEIHPPYIEWFENGGIEPIE